LSPGQERVLWQMALEQLAATHEDPQLLGPHTSALMRAAAQATQSLLVLARSAATEEEQLLVAALQQVRALCRQRDLVSLGLAPPEELGFVAGSPPPFIIGQMQLTPLQQQLHALYWPDAQLLATPDASASGSVELLRAASLQAEMAACATWCRDHLQQDGARRLLVVSVWRDPGVRTQGALLWRALADGFGVADADQQALLAVEGGEPLLHQTLVSDALAALTSTSDRIDTALLLQCLRSAYFSFGSSGENHELALRLGRWGLARWSIAALDEALTGAGARLPAAARMLAWLQQSRALLAEVPRRSATGWAECFTQCLQFAGFATGKALDSRDAQRLQRWAQLLDEFAALDAALAPMNAAAALQQLRQLAQQSSHQAATGDAAITFTTQLHDPVIQYDGIWVMGLAESRWPEPPRPDPYVPLHEQRRCNWPQAVVTNRLQSAQWLQQCWQQRTGDLVLGFAQQEGDVHHRPSALLLKLDAPWRDAVDVLASPMSSLAPAVRDRSMPRIAVDDAARPLPGGVERLRLQQECAFHAQAEWRLGAAAPARFTEGVPSRLRGMLLHSLLEGLWEELRDHAQLLALSPEEQSACFARHWTQALQKNAAAGVGWLSPAVLERERLRAARLVDRVLDLDRSRAPFAVRLREHEALLRAEGASLRMRIDRIDQVAGGEHLLIDYKSGAAGAVRLQEGEARPLQLAAYVVALAEAGTPVSGALLLSLKPAQLEYSGAADVDMPVPRRVKPVADWPAAQQQWQRELQQLLTQHLEGAAQLADSIDACRYCHLPAFCRRRALGDAAPEEEGGDD
jgi:ATP-dependent helicase/nuclease subunit B